MVLVFEHGTWFPVHNRPALESHLKAVWQQHRELWADPAGYQFTQNNYQPFLQFDGTQAKANNFIGFVHHQSMLIEIYPKVFQNLRPVRKDLMHSHLLYWLKYTNRIKFPFSQANLDQTEVDRFPELLLYLVARQIHESVKTQPFSSFEEVHEALSWPRGTINFSRYSQRISYGDHHRIECDHEPFIFDNTLNRTIKYCARLMLSATSLSATQNLLNEVLFVLDDVEDTACSLQDLSKIRLTPLFQTYQDVIQCCRMLLQHQIYAPGDYTFKNWTLLLPMELIFEEFIIGFITRHFRDQLTIEPQKSDLFLQDTPPAFNIRHDMLLTRKGTGKSIIVDTKYKPRWENIVADPKKGVAQSDMYQMISYAFRRGVHDVLLLYPNTTEELQDDHVFTIVPRSGHSPIHIRVVDVPFWSHAGSDAVERKLKNKLESILLL